MGSQISYTPTPEDTLLGAGGCTKEGGGYKTPASGTFKIMISRCACTGLVLKSGSMTEEQAQWQVLMVHLWPQ